MTIVHPNLLDAPLEFGLGLLITALLMLVGHWFPWPVKLHRLAAYAYGCVAILVGSAIWLLSMNLGAIWLGFSLMIGIGGVATGIAYLVDVALRYRVYRQVTRERDE